MALEYGVSITTQRCSTVTLTYADLPCAIDVWRVFVGGGIAQEMEGRVRRGERRRAKMIKGGIVLELSSMDSKLCDSVSSTRTRRATHLRRRKLSPDLTSVIA